ncbi:MAG: hypothetical protein IAG13_11090 [Deltaproteobacteria bacterium]|nr:hypothetical protein [Nannocystaceae bacterium]
MSYTPAMPATLTRFALALGVSLLAALPVPADAGSSQRAALVRVEVIEGAGATAVRSRSTQTVAWDHAASVRMRVAGHEHRLLITPSEREHGLALFLDHARDGEAIADDLHVTSTTRRAVIEAGAVRVVVSVVPVTTHLEVTAD